ncbi:MAG: FtsX-like permease family protein, partial [Acidobacteriota bacterium]
NAGIERLQLPFPVDLTLGLALDYRVALFTLAMSSLAAIVFGLAPAFEATRANLSSTLGEESRGSSSGLGKRRLRNALVVGQVALTLVLLISAGLAVRSMRNAHRIDPGFDTRGLVVASLSPDRQGYDEEQTKAFLRQLDERLTARPEIQSVGYASHIPLTLNISTTLAIAEGQDAVPTEEWPEVDTARVGPDYLETMGIPLLRGRSFSQWDDADAPRVAVVNETMAAQLWPGEEAIGQRMNLDDDGALVEVIGIARDGKYRTLGEQQRAFFYSPLEQGWSGSQTMIVRTRGDRHEALATIRQQVRELDENLAVSDLQTVEEATATALVLPRAGASLFGLFGVVGLMLATIGIYGVVSYLVSQRTHEIGIRMAMGAKRWDILRLVVREGIGLTAGGVVLGVLVASVATRALSSVLYGVSATDFLTFVGVSLFLTLIALVATVIPAHRASRFDPLVALRQE